MTHHDQKTQGIMGLLPLVQDLPIRITQTVNRELRLFKNKRCFLHGWELHPVDNERLKNHTAMELVLQHMPVRLFVRS